MVPAGNIGSMLVIRLRGVELCIEFPLSLLYL